MDNSRFFVLQPRAGRSLTEQADDLQRQMQDVLQEVGGSLDNLLQMRVYVSDAANQCALLRSHRLVADHAPLGVVSFVEHPRSEEPNWRCFYGSWAEKCLNER